MISESNSYLIFVFWLFSIIFLLLKLNFGDCISKYQLSNEEFISLSSLKALILLKFKDITKLFA